MLFFGKIGIKNLIIFGLIFIFVLFVSLPFLLNQAVNTSYVKEKLTQKISQKTDGDFNVSKFSITLLPELSINIDNFIFNFDKKTNISIKAVKFNLDPVKLMTGKIDITYISIIQPEIGPEFGSEFLWPGLKTTVSKKEQPSIQPVDGLISQIALQLIKGAKKLFTLLPKHQNSIEFEFKNVKTPYFRQMDGSFYLSKKKEQIIF